jgi:2,5-diamino-6-(ribosylamino)-4(3H)-pyrimidinone 5'-phosphate reductase
VTASEQHRPRPYSVAHVAVSLEGATRGFDVDLGRYYGLVGTWHEDVTLTGADTILAQEAALASAPGPGPAEGGPLLAVVDGRGRVGAWEALRNAGYWSDVLALRCESTPPRPADRHVDELVLGADRVDLAAVFDEFGRRGAEVVRVDSGGRLLGALLQSGLLDEISLLIHPCFAGAGSDAVRWYGPDAVPVGRFHLIASQSWDDELVWLRYRR